jgi:hypothetical protein
VRTSEWLPLGYFTYLLVVSAVLRVRRPAFNRIAIVAAGCALPIAALAGVPGGSRVTSVVRDWLPGLYLLLAYWASGQAYRGPDLVLEEKLAHGDARLFRALGPLILRVPRVLLEGLEFAYLLCYPMIPAGLAVLYVCGRRVTADTYWTLVFLPTFAAYAVLPFAGSRPPRALGLDMWIEKRRVVLRRLNQVILRHGSIQVNTCPSAHATAATAAALFLVTTAGWPGVPFVPLVVGIAAGAIVGRYHYAFDVVAGVLLALAARVLAGGVR